MSKKVDTAKHRNLYLLKEKAAYHIHAKRYSWAMVYLVDSLREFDQEIEEVDDSDEMELLIREIKIPCHKNLSLCYLKQGNYSSCIEHCNEVLSIEPNCVKILYRMGISYLNLNNNLEAERYLRRAFILEPNEKQVMKALERVQQKNVEKLNQIQLQQTEGAKQVSIYAIIKLLFFWPFILMALIWRKLLANKQRVE